jgi:nitroreductase
VVVVVSGGIVYRGRQTGLFRAGKGAPYEPWQRFRDAAERGPLALVAAAILAANPHNTQPWKFRVTADRIDVFADRSRHLGHMDPFLREMHLGLGCALENLVQASGAFGYRAEVSLLPTSDPDHVARVDLVAIPVQRSPLHAWIAERHTDRGPYDPTRAVGAPLLASWRGERASGVRLLLFPRESDQGKLFLNETIRATEQIVGDSAMLHDSARWFRNTPAQIEAHPDGPSVLTAGLSRTIETLAILGPELSAEVGHGQWLAATREVHCRTAQGFGTLCVPARRDLRANLEAGRLWQRLHLMGAEHGVSMQPMNQLPEMVDRARELGVPKAAPVVDHLAARPGAEVTFCFRYGYGLGQPRPSARRSLGDVLLAAPG